MPSVPDWRHRIAALADQLARDGELRTVAWQDAFRAVPRHVLVPFYFEPTAPGRWARVSGDEPATRERWLAAVYSDRTLVTALSDVVTGAGTFQVAASSSTTPGLMVRMLEDLDIDDHHRVLEIGTATGYNAALLCARLGDTQVFSVELQDDLVDQARERLARLGFRPTLVAGDGSRGIPGHAPYDRLIATCSVTRIPPAWIEQTRPGAVLLADIEGPLLAGNIAKLHRAETPEVEGRFLTHNGARYGSFMALRQTPAVPPPAAPALDTSQVTERTTDVVPSVLQDWTSPVGFLAQLHLPADVSLSQVVHDDRLTTRLTSADGVWCETAHDADPAGRHPVREGGPTSLWAAVERADQVHASLGRPGWDRFGITAGITDQHVWFDSPHSDHRWPLAGDTHVDGDHQ